MCSFFWLVYHDHGTPRLIRKRPAKYDKYKMYKIFLITNLRKL